MLLPLYVITSSSVVAQRLCDASCLSVVSFNIYIISYFGFVFTSAYNSTLFYCLRHKVEPVIHTIHRRL